MRYFYWINSLCKRCCSTSPKHNWYSFFTLFKVNFLQTYHLDFFDQPFKRHFYTFRRSLTKSISSYVPRIEYLMGRNCQKRQNKSSFLISKVNCVLNYCRKLNFCNIIFKTRIQIYSKVWSELFYQNFHRRLSK